LERTVVQLVEARRLADFDNVPHGRLALLLLDNAAETMLYRQAKEALGWAGWYSKMLKQLGPFEDGDDEDLKALREGLESKTVSEKTRKKIEQNFTDLVKFVFSRPDCGLERELASCLNALHRYRNAAYHQDFVSADVLGPANEIYFNLCCQLLKDQRFTMMAALAEPPASVAALLPDLPTAPVLNDEKTLGDSVADKLLAQHHLDHGGITSALAAHLVARIGVVERNLDEFITYLGYRDKVSALRVIQLMPYGDEPPTVPDDFLTRKLDVTDRTIQSWTRRAAAISDLSSAQDALRQFDEVESAVARFEDQLEPFMIAIDREIEREIDTRRGK
jgi:hypothetical protein